ncbi:hypothetical protein [Arsenicicoccus sp. oral taxon 190]|uniref:hypothetical protein n=1 Tax=Arsenicicoccus sp. oral taxon 190 TaxID=1658671 RepID=UPI000679F76B|nr:hypothetical protein [Arsenicicoccus sp. oral taxon 190]AKT52140.1 hypothetical protein ADJ73_14215 [Arsenicicoccus sp. oral taxon 190]
MPTPRLLRAFCSGVLAANATPHAYAAVVGATQLTPLAGRRSGPAVNALWASLNALGAVAVARPLDPGDARQRQAFKAGVAGFATWTLLSEWVTDLDG